MEGAAGFAPLRMTSTEMYAATFPTYLQYRTNGGTEAAEAPLNQPKNSRWWSPSLFSPGVKSTAEGDKNRAVDDYLEFLERRYHRLHDDDKQDRLPSTGAKFSALKWLKQGDDQDSPEAKQRQQDDALFVLGVAGLASQQLLQKHQKQHDRAAGTAAPPRLASSATAPATAQLVAIGRSAAKHEEGGLTPAAIVLSALLDRLKPLARNLALRRKLLLRYQAQQLNVLTALFARALTLGPSKAATTLWRMGGGKKNVAVTLTVMAALTVFVIRPLAEFLLTTQNA
jgi:hypothetical protein